MPKENELDHAISLLAGNKDTLTAAAILRKEAMKTAIEIDEDAPVPYERWWI